MPIVEVTLVEGRPLDKKRKLVAAVTDALVESLDAPRASVRVILREIPAEHFAVGGELKFLAPGEG